MVDAHIRAIHRFALVGVLVGGVDRWRRRLGRVGRRQRA